MKTAPLNSADPANLRPCPQAAIFLDGQGSHLDRHAAAPVVPAWHDEPESPSESGPTPCATPSSLPPLTPVYRCVTCRKPPATLTTYDDAIRLGPGLLDRHATYIVATFLAGASRDDPMFALEREKAPELYQGNMRRVPVLLPTRLPRHCWRFM